MSNPRNRRARRAVRKKRGCTSKVRFANQMAALRAGAKRGLNWYHCPYCHGWHLTSKNTGLVNHKHWTS